MACAPVPQSRMKSPLRGGWFGVKQKAGFNAQGWEPRGALCALKVMYTDPSLSPAARLFGYAGLLPQILCLTIAGLRLEYEYIALACGFAYAAAIFSFLGGVWWGQAISSGKARADAYLLSVLPSLLCRTARGEL